MRYPPPRARAAAAVDVTTRTLLVLLASLCLHASISGGAVVSRQLDATRYEVVGALPDSQDVILVERHNNETVVRQQHADGAGHGGTGAGVKDGRVVERLEQETGRQFELLRVNYSRLLADLDLELRSGRGLPRIVEKALRYFDLKQVVQEIETSVMSKVSCTACKAGVGLIQHYLRGGKTRDDIIKITYQFCVSLKIQSPRVCEGLTHLFGGEVVYVLKRVNLGPEEICSFVIGDACGDVYNPFHEWKVVFPPVPKPPVPEPKAPTEGAPTFKVLHLSDTHFDPYYQEGSNADCKEPLCCRLTNGPALSPATAAGRWGDYRKCDTPKRTVDNMLQHIASTHPDIDYIIWTGDLPPHDVWNQTKEENLAILKETVAQMVQLFPKTPIFPALGNHEAAPVNSFPPPFVQKDYSIAWLYEELYDQWKQWLPSTVSRTVRRGAFYSVLVRPGFRVISLNMNYCNNKNWWLLLNSTDPARELQWFIYELQSAEFNEEKVHIIGHIPPGHADCLKVWSRNYYRIINRYESTIVSQFFGHTHYDEFELFYDTENLGRAVGVAYIGPSVTPYLDLNPGYRIYYVDGDHEDTTRAVVDHETWVMNLKEANLYDYPIWYKLYSARAAYQLQSLLPQQWDGLVNRAAADGPLFDTYYKHYWKNSPVRPLCDGECKKRMVCDLRSGKSHDRKVLCQEIESRIDANTRTGWRAWIYNSLALSYVTNFWSGQALQIIFEDVDDYVDTVFYLPNPKICVWSRLRRVEGARGHLDFVLQCAVPCPAMFSLNIHCYGVKDKVLVRRQIILNAQFKEEVIFHDVQYLAVPYRI